MPALIQGCTTAQPPAPPATYPGIAESVPVTSAATITPQTALLKLNRPSAFYAVLKTSPILLNGRPAGSLSSGESISIYVTPGHLRLTSDYKMKPLDLLIKGGHEYLVDLDLRWSRFELISETAVVEPAAERAPPPTPRSASSRNSGPGDVPETGSRGPDFDLPAIDTESAAAKDPPTLNKNLDADDIGIDDLGPYREDEYDDLFE